MTGRRTSLVIACLAAAVPAWAAPARAGTYDVLVCDAAEGIGGGNLALELSSNDSFANETHCPTDNNYPDGIIHRNRQNAGKANHLRGARGTFTAPPGTTVREVFWRGAMSRAGCQWGLGIVANNRLLYGLPANSSCAQVGLSDDRTVAIGAPSFQTAVACGSVDGCATAQIDGGWHGYQVAMRTNYLRIRVDDPTPPSVSGLGGPLASGAWVRGPQAVTFNASDGAGILVTRLRVDGADRAAAWRVCDFRRAAPCSNVSGGSHTFNTSELADGEHELIVDAGDPGWNLGSATATLRSDNSPPARPTGVTVDGGEGWRQSNSFDVSWTNPDGQYAPITGARYSLCPAGVASGCSSGAATGEGISRLAGITVPAPGDWELRIWLEDQAGNVDEKTASDPVRLRFDDEPPTVVFEPQDPNDPRRIGVTVTDGASGVAGGSVEISRAGSDRWQALETTFAGDKLTAYPPDDRLADGRYLLRAYAGDAAGNQGAGDRRADGALAELTLPVRIATRLRAGVSKRVRVRRGRGKRTRVVRRLHRRSHVGLGRRVLVRGRLVDRARQPVAAQQLSVWTRTGARGRFRPLGVVTTDRRGRFRYRVRTRLNRTIRVYYAGTPLIRSVSADVVLLVRARATLSASRKHARNGQAVTFGGRFLAQRRYRAGKLVELQARVGKRWRTFATARTDDGGRYGVRYRFKSTTGRVTYKFRARLPKERAFPYEPGRSRVKTVTVRGR